ncbi:MAG: bacteriohemerythrin [Zoogloeaceae bacterium]|jgi:hemerythrin|nr:bacteriohemerythrin [Zoogloeaceae bacterium]
MSKNFVWSDDYSVGIDEIDEQHKTLFHLINQLHEAILEKKGSTACRTILHELVEYTRVHFALEQTLMRVGNYPKYEEHCKLHKDLVEEVEALQHKIASGHAAISFELLQFLRNWLTKHILEEDMKYGAFFKTSNQHKDIEDWSEKSRESMRKHKKKSAWWKFW